MGKHGKNILLTIVIGSVIFLIGNIFYNDFRFNSPQEFLYSFGMYQLYSFVLGFSNMYFFTWMEGLNWK
ncbi:MAG: histidine kinase, partial [Mangrovimonas sp.]|nr:histidine kinase [Mangrovimonas sp.]